MDAAANSLARGEFTYCASLIRQTVPNGQVARFVRSRFRAKRSYPPALKDRMANRLDNLLTLPSAGVITTNYDNVIDSKVARIAGIQICKGDTEQLGGLLLDGFANLGFFLKVHGDLEGPVVFSSEEYDERYLRTGGTRTFIKAAMLRYVFLFLGCSIENELLRIRREMVLDFGRALPPCYFVTAKTADSEVRGEWMSNYGAVSTIFYDNPDGSHREFDTVLAELAQTANSLYHQNYGLLPGGSVRRLLARPLRQRRADIGVANTEILDFVQNTCRNAASWSDVMGLKSATSRLLRGVSEAELMYRAYYLISIGLLVEGNSGVGTILSVPLS